MSQTCRIRLDNSHSDQCGSHFLDSFASLQAWYKKQKNISKFFIFISVLKYTSNTQDTFGSSSDQT